MIRFIENNYWVGLAWVNAAFAGIHVSDGRWFYASVSGAVAAICIVSDYFENCHE